MASPSSWTQPDNEYDLLDLGYDDSNFSSDHDSELDFESSSEASDSDTEANQIPPLRLFTLSPSPAPGPAVNQHTIPASVDITDARAVIRCQNRMKLQAILNEIHTNRKELEEKHRYFIFALRYQAGWSVRRVARTLKVPKSTVCDIGPDENNITTQPRSGPAPKLTAEQR